MPPFAEVFLPFIFFESENNKYETSYIKITVLLGTPVVMGL